MTFLQSIRAGFRQYADFSGTAARAEFWWWLLFTTLTGAAVDIAADLSVGQPFLGSVWALCVIVPSLAVAVRRLRDAAFHWGHVFWLLLPIAGMVIIAVLCVQPTAARGTAHAPTGAGPLGATGGRS